MDEIEQLSSSVSHLTRRFPLLILGKWSSRLSTFQDLTFGQLLPSECYPGFSLFIVLPSETRWDQFSFFHIINISWEKKTTYLPYSQLMSFVLLANSNRLCCGCLEGSELCKCCKKENHDWLKKSAMDKGWESGGTGGAGIQTLFLSNGITGHPWFLQLFFMYHC